MKRARILAAVIPMAAIPVLGAAPIDADGDGYGDVWQMIYKATGLPHEGDPDGDGESNLAESKAGTNPFDPNSVLHPVSTADGGAWRISWQQVAGKSYAYQTSPRLSGWISSPAWTATATGISEITLPRSSPSNFFRIAVAEADTDRDGISDSEEYWLRFDPARANTERRTTPDSTRIRQGLTAANTLTLAVYDGDTSERWPEPAVIVIRRKGGLQPLAVNIALAGTASAGVDYNHPGTKFHLEAGQREAFVEIAPLPDNRHSEGTETVIATLLPGDGYTLGNRTNAAVNIADSPPGSAPSAEEAARFLIQAAFGPDQDSAEDADIIPENVEEVQAMGFGAWIDDQMTRPVGTLQPFVEWCEANASGMELYGDYKEFAWWNRAMGVPRLRPDSAGTQLPDPLRQRVAFALSQILVVSDRTEALAVEPRGLANYYDMLLSHSFGNYRDILHDVSLHPCMGLYLSHLGNRKPDQAGNIFPDENYAREIMQLFSIGLWMLNPDGSRKLDETGSPIPSYDNRQITEFARVFTGLAFGGANENFGLYPQDFTTPMKGWDAEHDLAPKTLLLGATTPARAASPGNTGTATMADVNAAIDNLFNHPNTAPFISIRLIQRLVTSNPSPAYIGRVAAVFEDNGSGIRGDMAAVVKAILMDPEARGYGFASRPDFGKVREPFLRCVNFAHAFNASAPAGFYALGSFTLDHNQEPLKSPSVFNFYLPTYAPPGPLTEYGLAGPEFQILNATSMHTGPNYFWNAVFGGLHRWGTAIGAHDVTLNLAPEMALNLPPGTDPDEPVPNVTPLDPDPLIRRIDLALTGGTLSPENHRIIREALQRVGAPTWEWPKQRLRLAIYLIVSSPEFNVIR
jgi:uncharacterized protein (DUF1800 family)